MARALREMLKLSEWTNADKLQPDNIRKVLVLINEHDYPYVAFYDNQWWLNREIYGFKVKWWRELPPMPKEGK